MVAADLEGDRDVLILHESDGHLAYIDIDVQLERLDTLLQCSLPTLVHWNASEWDYEQRCQDDDDHEDHDDRQDQAEALAVAAEPLHDRRTVMSA